MAKGTQTIWASIVEAKANIAIGYAINATANVILLPLFGWDDLSVGKAILLGLPYTLISIVRQFVIRRWFNNMHWGHSHANDTAK